MLQQHVIMSTRGQGRQQAQGHSRCCRRCYWHLLACPHTACTTSPSPAPVPGGCRPPCAGACAPFSSSCLLWALPCPPGPHLHELPVACPERHVGHTLLDAGVEVKVVLSQEGQGGGVTQEPAGQEGGTARHSRWDAVQHTSGGCEERGCQRVVSFSRYMGDSASVSNTLPAGCWQLVLLLLLWLTSGCHCVSPSSHLRQ